MSEIKKDPGIMLFGRKIPLPECQILANSGAMKTEAEENVESTGSGDEEKMMKRPDKILRCPRCRSMETKFCYFNNYNVNQPRHFCKSCQRYWTAGGTMRSVPVGAGRRKHKHLPSQIFRPESKGSPSEQDNVSLLKFGPDTDPLLEPMLNLRDRKITCVDSSSINCAQHGEDSSFCGSSVTNVSATQGNNESSSQHNTPSWLQYYPYPPWILPWNNVPRTCAPSTIPVQLVPAFWSGTTPPATLGSGNGTLSIGSSNPSCISPSSSTSNSCCSENYASKTIGKNTRTRDTVSTNDQCVLAPKAPRIDEHNEASKTPMLVTFAIK